MMKKVLLTATVQSHICQFHKPLVKMLHENGYEVHVAAKDNLAEKNGLKLDFVDKVFNVPFSRSPKSADNIKAYKQLKEIITAEAYDIIHCNTPMGGIVTRLAAKKARKTGTKVYYTAHGFHFYKGASRAGWLIYYPIEKYMAKYTDKLITICNEDYQTAKNKQFNSEICYIHGVGADSARYMPATPEEKQALREQLAVPQDAFVFLCTGELNENKNQKTVISAFAKAVESCPNMMLLLAGNGPKEAALREQVAELGLNDRIKLLGYQTQLEQYVKLSDVVVSASHREGLGLNLIEAMLCQKPVLAADNRGHRDLVQQGVNGFLIPADAALAFADKMQMFYQDAQRCAEFGGAGCTYAQQFTDAYVMGDLKKIYNLA